MASMFDNFLATITMVCTLVVRLLRLGEMCFCIALGLEYQLMIYRGYPSLIYIIRGKRRYVCLSVSMFRMAGQTAGPIEIKLDTRTHVHPGSVSVKVIDRVPTGLL